MHKQQPQTEKRNATNEYKWYSTLNHLTYDILDFHDLEETSQRSQKYCLGDESNSDRATDVIIGEQSWDENVKTC